MIKQYKKHLNLTQRKILVQTWCCFKHKKLSIFKYYIIVIVIETETDGPIYIFE